MEASPQQQPTEVKLVKDYVVYLLESEGSEYIYEWHSTATTPTNGLEVWPRGQFQVAPIPGNIYFQYLDPPETITLEWVIQMLNAHEAGWYLKPYPDWLDTTSQVEVEDWEADMLWDLDYFAHPET